MRTRTRQSLFAVAFRLKVNMVSTIINDFLLIAALCHWLPFPPTSSHHNSLLVLHVSWIITISTLGPYCYSCVIPLSFISFSRLFLVSISISLSLYLPLSVPLFYTIVIRNVLSGNGIYKMRISKPKIVFNGNYKAWNGDVDEAS